MSTRRRVLLATPFLALAGAPGARAVGTPTATEIDRKSTAALARLDRTTPAARALGEKAYAVLIFPEVTKAGLMIGGEIGYGALREGGRTVGYYRTQSVSYGLQAGAQTFSYALFFMTPEARRWLDRSDGWEVGVGPSVVLVDEGMASRLTTTTAQSEIYAFVFGQSGLMAGLGVQGSKIVRVQPGR